MAENRASLFPQTCGKDMVCIDTYRVLDSCRDKDCFEDARVYLTCYGQEIIDRTTSVRAKSAKVLKACIDTESVPFNRGFYQLSIRLYIKVMCEACMSPGNLEELDGIAVVEKKVILFGSEGNVSIFKSEADGNCFCRGLGSSEKSDNQPVAVVETVDPIVLSSRVVEPQRCPLSPLSLAEVPETVASAISGELTDNCSSNKLLVSLGLFSVVRLERPAQYLINAVEYSVPEKECRAPAEDDPCSLFKSMSFPTNEFSPPSSLPRTTQSTSTKSCGCGE